MSMAQDERGTRPVPDPTVLTTEQLHREITALGERVKIQLDGAMDVIGERFNSTDTQFALIERQRVEQKKDTKDAVDAALTAQKEAVREQTNASERAIAKSEASTKEQLGQLTVTISTQIKGVVDSLDDLKGRVGNAEALKLGAAESRTESRAGVSATTAVIGIGLSFIALLAVIAGLYFATRPTAAAPPSVTCSATYHPAPCP